MPEDGRYVFSAEYRQALENLPIALAVYQYIHGRVVALLVSDGICRMYGLARDVLIQRLDQDMFGSVHPDDLEMLVSLGYRFATKESAYDVVYRTRVVGKEGYRTMHVVGKYQSMENGVRLANLIYTDITDTPQNLFRALERVSEAKARFLDECTGAMVIVSRNDERLLYFNKAMLRFLPPKCSFDSGITFRKFFFGDETNGFDRLFQAADEGVRTLEEPVTHQKFDITVSSCSFADEPAYAAYFFECFASNTDQINQISQLHSRATFDLTMFTGDSTPTPYYSSGYRGYRVWNLTQNSLARVGACNLLFDGCGKSPSYDSCLNRMIELCCDQGQREQIMSCTRERLLQLFASGTYPRQFALTLQTEHGVIYASLSLTMMRSPYDDEDVFLKIEEKNVSDEVILDALIEKTLEQDYDYIAYSDLNANRCRVISGKTAVPGQKSYVVKTSEQILSPADIRSISSLFPPEVHSLEEMHAYLVSTCGSKRSFTTQQELPGGIIKSICFELIDPDNKIFFIRCKDITELLRNEREREKELEQAVHMEHDKVERVLVQTVLSISNALDARDPLTRRHSQRVAQYSAEIARRLSWPEESIQNLYNIALVHDIGKIGIPDAVLQKKGKLTSQEYLLIQDHVAIGAFILKDFTAFHKVAEGALYHHERYDGAGYMRGLAGEQIPIEARIIGLADAVDAMNSTRPYRERQSEDFLRSELIAGRGRQFDPALVDVMLQIIDDGVLEA